MSEQPEIAPPATERPAPVVTAEVSQRPSSATPSGNGAALPEASSGPRRTWLNYYAQELLRPISALTRRCELCNRKLWRGYLLEKATVITGVSDMRIVCWRCKLAAARQHMERLRAARR
jgi:hypothetical protein